MTFQELIAVFLGVRLPGKHIVVNCSRQWLPGGGLNQDNTSTWAKRGNADCIRMLLSTICRIHVWCLMAMLRMFSLPAALEVGFFPSETIFRSEQTKLGSLLEIISHTALYDHQHHIAIGAGLLQLVHYLCRHSIRFTTIRPICH